MTYDRFYQEVVENGYGEPESAEKDFQALVEFEAKLEELKKFFNSLKFSDAIDIEKTVNDRFSDLQSDLSWYRERADTARLYDGLIPPDRDLHD